MGKSSIDYIFHNKDTQEITVNIEPWAEEFSVPSGSTLSIAISYGQIGRLETEMGSGTFTMWLWSGCSAEVALDGEDRTPRSLAIPAPF